MWVYDPPMTKPAAFPSQFIYVQLNSMWNLCARNFFPVHHQFTTQNHAERGKQINTYCKYCMNYQIEYEHTEKRHMHFIIDW